MKIGQTGLFGVSRGMYLTEEILRGIIVDIDGEMLTVETEYGERFKFHESEFTLCYMRKGDDE